MNKKYFFLFLVLILSTVIISGCINQQPEKKELYNVTKDGVEYIFSNNVYESLNITIENEDLIRQTLDSPLSVVIAFNGSNEQDNGYFSVVSYNLVEKLKNYYIYSKGKRVGFAAIDINEGKIPPGNTIIVLRGPNTSARGTSVYYDNECIVNQIAISEFSRCVMIQGTDYKNLTLASEKLILSLLDFKG